MGVSAPGSVLQTADRGILLLGAGHPGEAQIWPQHTPHGAGGRVGGMGAHLTLEDTRGKGRNSVPGTAGQEKLPWTWGQNGARPSSQN